MNKDVEQYFSAVPPGRKERIEALHELVTTLYPKATVDMSYKMPTYKAGEGWVSVANQKNYISLYTCAPQHIEGFKAKHPDIKTGKGCINFRDKDELHLNDLKAVIKHAITKPKG